MYKLFKQVHKEDKDGLRESNVHLFCMGKAEVLYFDKQKTNILAKLFRLRVRGSNTGWRYFIHTSHLNCKYVVGDDSG